MPLNQSMTGWKVKTGTFLVSLGPVLLGASEIAPNPELESWFKFIGTLITGFGTALTAWGIAHKIEKNKTT